MTLKHICNPAPQSIEIHVACDRVSVTPTDTQGCKPPGLGSSLPQKYEGHSRRDSFVVSQGASY